MKKRILKVGAFLSIVTLSTIGVKMANTEQISSMGLVFSNMEALASSSEGEGGKSFCYISATASDVETYLRCVSCEWVSGRGIAKGGYCK